VDYLENLGNQKKKLPSIQSSVPTLSPKPAVQGEIVTPTPANFTAPKALPNNSFIEGGISRPTLAGTKPAMASTTPTPTQTPALSQLSQKPSIPPYQPAQAANPVSQFGKIPPPTGGGITANPAFSASSAIANGFSKLAAATPAIQSGMNASAIMNQEANFAKNIHAGSIADPNFGNELMGDKQSFSRTQTPAPKLSTGVIGVGRAGTQPVPDQYINSRAGQSVNPAYTQYAASHPTPAVAPAPQSATQLRNIQVPDVSKLQNQTSPKMFDMPANNKLAGTKQPSPPTNNQPAMPTGMNDVTSGTGYIKGGNSAFKNGVGFVQNADGMMGSDGKQRMPQRGLSMPTISDNRMDNMVLDHLSAQRESGAITAQQAVQIYAQHQAQTQVDAIQKMPLDQRAKAAMQFLGGQGNIQAAQQLGTEQYQQGTLANQKATQEAENEKTQYARNTPAKKAEDAKENLHLELIDAAKNGDADRFAKAASAFKQYHSATEDPQEVGLREVATDNGVDGKRTEKIPYNKITGQDIPQPDKPTSFDPEKEKEGVNKKTGEIWKRQP
jgi:hypothetical protein